MIFFIPKYSVRSIKEVLGHAGCWLLFIGYELSVLWNINGQLEPFYFYVVYYAINIAFFYGHVSLLNAVFYRPKRAYLLGFVGYILLIAFFLCIKSLADFSLDVQQPPIQNPLIYIKGFIARNLVRLFYFTVLATIFWFAGYVSYTDKRKATAERMRLLAENEKAELTVMLEKTRNAYLQQQINPHMLFNTLNFVYNSVQQHSEDAAHCVWLLAEIMRFSMEEMAADGKVELSREAKQMEHLLAINRYRYHHPIWVDLAMEGDFQDFRIIPLILLTLTENVFKHGQLSDKNQPVLLRMGVQPDGQLLFYSRNLKKSKNNQRGRPALGLQNVRIRLDAAYADNYQLSVNESDDLYELTLTLKLCT